MGRRNTMSNDGAGTEAPAVSEEDRAKFVGGAQVGSKTQTKAAKKPRMFRFGPEDDDRLAELLRRAAVARVQPRPTGADIVRAGLRSLEQLDPKQLARLLSEDR